MGGQEIFSAAGGGWVGLLAVAVFGLFGMLIWQYESRIKEKDKRIERQDIQIEKLIETNGRQSEVIISWTPGSQRRQALRAP